MLLVFPDFLKNAFRQGYNSLNLHRRIRLCSLILYNNINIFCVYYNIILYYIYSVYILNTVDVWYTHTVYNIIYINI